MKNVDNDVLERHAYEDSEGHTLYICPICDREYLAAFITEENGRTMCIDNKMRFDRMVRPLFAYVYLILIAGVRL